MIETCAVWAAAAALAFLVLTVADRLKGAKRTLTFQCTKTAEWILEEKNLYRDTYSCTEHLSRMVSDETSTIDRYYDEEKCCYLGPKCSISESAPFDG